VTLFDTSAYETHLTPNQPSSEPPLRPSVRAHFGIALIAASITALAIWLVPGIVVPYLTPYTMSEDMAQIAERIGFTDEGMELFTDARPELMDSAEFLAACADPAAPADSADPGDGGETDEGDDGDWSSIGCYDAYVYDHGRIAVFRPTDERLADQSLVTTAHEFLHAAYSRMTYDERQEVNGLLAARWEQVPADAPIQEELASSVGGFKANRATEQFAYLGTEIAEDFDPALEAVYARYLSDRSVVVDSYLADQALWNGLYDTIEAKSDALDAMDASYEAEDEQLKADRAQLEADREWYDSTLAEFTALSASERSRSYVEGLDGGPDEPYGDYLAQYSAELDAIDAELAARQQQLDALGNESDVAWAELEPLYDEFDALADASVPSTE
jgi:hypothetical protein